MAREGAQPGFPVEPGTTDPHNGGMTFTWSSNSAAVPASAAEADTSRDTINELQSTIQFIMVRIESLERRPLYWNAQIAELRQASSQLDACRHSPASSQASTIQQVQQYTDSVNAQLDEFLTQEEARERQQRQASTRQQQTAAHQPSAPAFASAPPLAGQTATPGISATSNAPAMGSGGWSWKWGWGPAPAGTLPDEATSSTEAQQSSGIGVAGAAAALAAVGTAAAAAYRRMAGSTAQSGSNPTPAQPGSGQVQQPASASTSGRAQMQSSSATSGDASAGAARRGSATSGTNSSGSAWQQPPHASSSTTSATGSGPPVQGVYDAVRNIFDRHVSPNSSLGRWGEVARHLNDLHGQMNAEDSQRQDVGRLLATAVNAYGAYRRATAASPNP